MVGFLTYEPRPGSDWESRGWLSGRTGEAPAGSTPTTVDGKPAHYAADGLGLLAVQLAPDFQVRVRPSEIGLPKGTSVPPGLKAEHAPVEVLARVAAALAVDTNPDVAWLAPR